MSYGINDIRNGLNTVLDKDELYLCYQPLVNIKTNKVVSLEALVRWNHPLKGKISPLDFIPIAEETNHIISIGEWILEEACKQLKLWHEMDYKKYVIAVNVSSIQLQQVDFSENVTRILAVNGLSPESLELEITETVFLKSISTVKHNLMRLKKLGVRISIDDFGTGYNSFTYLKSIEVNNLKIDKTFIDDYKTNVNEAIIDSIITIGHKINAGVIAEGVETKEQYDYLKEKDCDTIQGYYFSEPLLPEKVIDFLSKEPY